jgi:ABC-type multidrug transport system fused ATPase/permease subunit
MLLADIGQGNLLVTMFWLFILMLWFWLLITVFADLFSDKEESGLSKTLWVLFVIFLPYLGVFVYLISRGPKMSERAIARQQQAQEQFKEYVQQTAGGSSGADELAKLHDLNKSGALSDEEYASMKAKIVAG